MTLPRIALCVVTYNSAELVEGLIASIPAGAAGTAWTLVFADNSSSDETVARIGQLAPDATLVQTGSNLGYSGGVNAAIEAAGSQDAYLVLNADVRLAPGCVLSLYEALGPGTGITVPRLFDGDGELIWSLRRQPTLVRAWADALVGATRAGRLGNLGEVVCRSEDYLSSHHVDWAEGSTQLLSADCLRICGRWDEDFFLYSEETEYNLRARDRGVPVRYVPSAMAQHLKGESAQSPQLWSLLVLNKFRLYASRHRFPASCLYWLALLTREGTRTVLGKRTSRAAVRDLLRPQRWRQPRGPEWLAGVAT